MVKVVAASSLGTAFEWYDFFLFGTLASTITRVFTGGNESAGFVFTLGAFAAGFFVRPFGAMLLRAHRRSLSAASVPSCRPSS